MMEHIWFCCVGLHSLCSMTNLCRIYLPIHSASIFLLTRPLLIFLLQFCIHIDSPSTFYLPFLSPFISLFTSSVHPFWPLILKLTHFPLHLFLPISFSCLLQELIVTDRTPQQWLPLWPSTAASSSPSPACSSSHSTAPLLIDTDSRKHSWCLYWGTLCSVAVYCCHCLVSCHHSIFTFCCSVRSAQAYQVIMISSFYHIGV